VLAVAGATLNGVLKSAERRLLRWRG